MADAPSIAVTAVNAAVRFLLELAALVVFGYWGYSLGSTQVASVGLGIGVPLGVAVVWALFGSPAAPYRLGHPWRLLLELAVLGGAAVALAALDRPTLAVAFAVAAGINTALLYVLGQA